MIRIFVRDGDEKIMAADSSVSVASTPEKRFFGRAASQEERAKVQSSTSCEGAKISTYTVYHDSSIIQKTVAKKRLTFLSS